MLKRYNLILVYNKEMNKILMCLRAKEPYKGLFNLVGGKIEDGENEAVSAYRELKEETGITEDDIKLVNLMDFIYIVNGSSMKVYVGILNKNINLMEEVNKLYWIDSNSDFFDIEKFAGYGNIGSIVKEFETHYEKIKDLL